MQNDAHKVLLKTQEYYTQVFNTYTSQHKLSTFIFIEYAQLDHLIEEFKEKNKETKFTLFSEYIKLLVVKIKEIEVMMITMHNVPK
jgi:glucosamine 6-phosphate synthetase-like amidotransferase/phosphosugar isomerase protein